MEIEFSHDDIINAQEEGMSFMASLTKKLILACLEQKIPSDQVVSGVLKYLQDFCDISPEMSNEYFSYVEQKNLDEN